MTLNFSETEVFTLLHKSSNSNKIEIVIPVRNEEQRLKYLIEGLRDNFKLIFLDGGSTDNTVELIKSYDCDVYLRNDPKYYGVQTNPLAQSIFDAQNGTSWCMAYYINNISEADFILRLWADEYINKIDQIKIISYLKTTGGNIKSNRADWLYGHRIGSPTKYIISYRPGEAVWDDKVLHSDILSLSNEKNFITVEVEQFCLNDTAAQIVKISKYTKAEILRITKNKKFKYPSVGYRYGLMILSPFKHYRRYPTFKLFFITFLWQLMDCLIGHIIYFEMFYLNNNEVQNNIYEKYVKEN